MEIIFRQFLTSRDYLRFLKNCENSMINEQTWTEYVSKSIKIIIGSVLINTALSAKRGLGTFGCKTILLRMVIVAERIKNMNMLRSHQDTHMAYHLIPTNLRYSFRIKYLESIFLLLIIFQYSIVFFFFFYFHFCWLFLYDTAEREQRAEHKSDCN